MKIFVATLLILVTNLVYAKSAEIWCYSDKKLFFHEKASEVYFMNEALIVITKEYEYLIHNGDCLLKYKKDKK